MVGMAAALSLGVALILAILDRPAPEAWSRTGSAGAAASILSFNVIEGGRPATAALDAIDAAAPDIVCLQEMTPQLTAAFVQRLGSRYPHRVFEPRQRTQGVGIASRYPLSGGRVLTLGLRYLPAVAADADLPAGPVHIACVHLMPPHAGFNKGGDLIKRYQRNTAIRIAQTRALLDHLAGVAGPAIVLGDMNEWPGQAAMTLFRDAGFGDACHGTGNRCGPTWPGRILPLPAMFRIDHILGRGVTFSGAAVLEAGGSDHYPVAARVVLDSRKLAEGNAR